MDAKINKNATGILSKMITWWGHMKTRQKDTNLSRNNLANKTELQEEQPGIDNPILNIEDETNNSLLQYDDDVEVAFSDHYTRMLYLEGLLQKSPYLGSSPVLTIGYGFSNGELSVNLPFWQEKRFQESLTLLEDEKRESYHRLFASKYPGEAVVDGLPETVWLECVEPTLTILKTLGELKHRKCNLTLRKGAVLEDDSDASCKGDFDTIAPFLLAPFIGGLHMRMMRANFLALEGAEAVSNQVGERDQRRRNNAHIVSINGGHRSNQSRFLTEPYSNQETDAPLHRRASNAIQERRRHRQHRPYQLPFHNNNLPNNICSTTAISTVG